MRLTGRCRAIAFGAVLATVCCACATAPREGTRPGPTPSQSMSLPPPPVTPSVPVTAAPISPSGSLRAFVSATPGAGYASPIVTVNGTQTAVVEVTRGPADELLDVVSLGAQPSLEASLALPLEGAIANFPFLGAADAQSTGTTRIQTGDITGDGQPDFLVLLAAADNFPGVVVSNDGGSWRLVPTTPPNSSVYIGRNPKIAGGQLTSISCGGPACAPSMTLTWTYVSSGGGYFTSS